MHVMNADIAKVAYNGDILQAFRLIITKRCYRASLIYIDCKAFYDEMYNALFGLFTLQLSSYVLNLGERLGGTLLYLGCFGK